MPLVNDLMSTFTLTGDKVLVVVLALYGAWWVLHTLAGLVDGD